MGAKGDPRNIKPFNNQAGLAVFKKSDETNKSLINFSGDFNQAEQFNFLWKGIILSIF